MTTAVCLAPPRRIRSLTASKRSKEQTKSSCELSTDLPHIVAGCQREERAAQRLLYDQFASTVFRVAARMVGSDDAADVSQEVFLKAFRSIRQFSGSAAVGTWVYRIAVNESLQHLRRSKAERVKSLEWEPVDRAVAMTVRVQQREILDRAIQSLPADLRAILILRETEDLSYSEISETLNISEGTVASRIHRARNELKERLTDLGWDF